MDLRAELERLHHASLGWAMVCCRERRHEAEDVLQATYLKVLDGRARFDGRSSFRTWLFAVVRRTSAESRRQRWLRALRLEQWNRADVRAPALPSSEAAAASNEENRSVRAALGQLSQRQQQVLHLVFYQDLTLEEAAQTLQISLGSARTHFERGKQRLRAALTGRDAAVRAL
jgi:RNA polymerase sigma-70 factor, ECF subfamily